MSVHDLLALGDWLQRAGLYGWLFLSLFLVTVGSYRGWWYPGAVYREMRQERDNWRTVALGSVRLGHKAVDMAEGTLGIQ